MKTIDLTQFDAVYALLEGIKIANEAGSTDSVERLVNAAQDVLTGCTVFDHKQKEEK